MRSFAWAEFWQKSSLSLTGSSKGAPPISIAALFFSRLFMTAIFMTYPACLATLVVEWGMSGIQAGLIQTGFSAGFAISLLAASWVSDRLGPKRIFAWFNWLSAGAALGFALFARSYELALVLLTLVGLTQGGTYTPAIMLVAQNLPPKRRGAGVGWVVGGMSAGYVLSIALASGVTASFGYEAALISCAMATVLGALIGMRAIRGLPDRSAGTQGNIVGKFSLLRDRRSILLTVGYMGHCWELFGMWTWVPAFLTISLSEHFAENGYGLGGVGLGIAIAVALHLSGFFASFSMGKASDHVGRRVVLIGMAGLGMACSFGFGWSEGLAPILLLAFAAFYGFTSVGDSGVLTTAMTESVPPDQLGRALGVRSILGIGLGAVAPASFGAVLDVAPAGTGWGWAFALLGLGGLIAVLCAILLPGHDRGAT